MSTRTGAVISRPAKRFKRCNIRVKCVSTSGKKFISTTPLKVFSRETANKQNMSQKATTKAVTTDTEHDEDNSQVCTNDEGITPYQKRREKAYGSWEGIRERLLNGRVEEEAFDTEQQCWECGREGVELRCLECGGEYFCVNCANKTHEQKNYFHVLEKLKVNILIYILYRTNINKDCGTNS